MSTPPRTGSLTLRKFAGGRLVVEGVPPEVHTFPAKFLERELNEAVRIRVAIPVEDGEYVYEVTAAERGDWTAQLVAVPGAVVDRPKRRWFRRK